MVCIYNSITRKPEVPGKPGLPKKYLGVEGRASRLGWICKKMRRFLWKPDECDGFAVAPRGCVGLEEQGWGTSAEFLPAVSV